MLSRSLHQFLLLGLFLIISICHTAHVTAQPPAAENEADKEATKALVLEVHKSTNALCWELHKNYQNQPDFKQVYKKAFLLNGLASLLPEAESWNMGDLLFAMKWLQDQLFTDIAAWNEKKPSAEKTKLTQLLEQSGESVIKLGSEIGIWAAAVPDPIEIREPND